MSDDVRVEHDPEHSRYVLLDGGERVGLIEYREEPDAVVMLHTEVDPEREGSGLGSRLVGAALDDVRARGLRVKPVCPFVGAYVGRHPEYGDLLAS